MIGIRTDANDEIAMGHVMRCLSIASQLKQFGENCIFIVSDESAKNAIQQYDYEVICLNNLYKEKEQEISALSEIINRNNIVGMIVDSYEVTDKYLSSISRMCYVVYIDDLNHIKFPVDMIVNYTYGIEKDAYVKWKYSSNTQFLLGSQYIPLREQFSNSKIEVNDSVKNIFITTGGSDPFHFLENYLLFLEGNEVMDNRNFICVIGRYFGDKAWLYEYSRSHMNIKVYENVVKMSQLMTNCDIAISASGTTLAELCSCGIPTIAFSMADNQIQGVKQYANDNLLIYAGDIRNVEMDLYEKIYVEMKGLCNSKERRLYYSQKSQNAIDGKGASRIAETIVRKIFYKQFAVVSKID